MTARPHRDDPLLNRWRAAARRAIRGADADLVEEVAQHLMERWVRARSEGLSEQEADGLVSTELEQWRAARRRLFPGPAAWRSGWSTDARYALRSLRVRPLMTVATILLTAVAVAADVTAFAVAYGILWRPLAYPDAKRLAVLWQVREGEQTQISYPDYADVSRASVFDGSAALAGGRGSLRLGDRIERVNVIELEEEGFSLLGATPFMGRLLNAGDIGQPTAMISHRLWRHHLNADPNLIGRPIWLSGREYTIAGVLPPGFDFELPITPTLKLERHDVWTVFDRSAPLAARRDASTYEALVRLAPGTPIDQAQVAVDAIGERLAARHADTNAERTFRVVPLKAQVVAAARTPIMLVCVAALAALVIALANLVTLALLRLTERQTELAVREAVGADRFRLRRQMFAEHALTAGAGAVAGFALATVVTRGLTTTVVVNVPRADSIHFDAPVVAFTVGLVALIPVVLSLLPLRMHPMAALRVGSRGAGRLPRRARQFLVAVELALALALSAGGALLGLSFARLLATYPGFASSAVATVRVSTYQARYPSLEHVQVFMRLVLDRLVSLPEVERAAAGSSLPLSGQTTGTAVVVEGRPTPAGSRQGAGWQVVTPGYFRLLDMAVLHGNDFTAADVQHDGHVTIINQVLARALFGAENPVGQRLSFGDGDVSDDWHRIVGVVADVRHHALDEPPEPRIYDLFGEHWGRTMYLVVKSRMLDAEPLIPAVRRVVAEIDRDVPVFEEASMDALVSRSAAPYRLAAILAGGLAVTAVVLALVGVYAVSGGAVAERRREISVRAALGARPRDLVRLVLGEGLLTACAGGIAGLGGAVAAARLLTAQVFGVHTADIARVIILMSALVFMVAAAATLPAVRRAARADPIIAMRTE